MKRLNFKGALMLLSLCLMTVLSACHNDYPLDDGPVASDINCISGSVASMDGKGIAGASVTLGGDAEATATTDNNGYFSFAGLKPGNYTVSVTAAGKIGKSTSITVEKEGSSNVVWNVMLASESSSVQIPVTTTATTAEGEITTEALEGNDKAEVPVEVEVPANSVNKPATIKVSPIYYEEEAATRATRDAESTMLVGARLSCDDSSVKIESPLSLSFVVDNETATAVTARKYVDGNWVDVPCEVKDGKVVVAADEFTSYGIFLGIEFTVSTREAGINFEQTKWDNLYGKAPIKVDAVAYDYKVGTKIETKGINVLTALIVETVARRFGANAYDAKGSYPIDTTVAVGTALNISGVQQINSITASAKGRSVSATQYGTVTVTARLFNRNHTGGNGSSTGF